MDGRTQLCSHCRTLPIPTLLYRPGPYTLNTAYQTSELEVGSLKEIYTPDNCALCALLRQTLNAWYGQQYLESQIRRFDTIRVWLYGAPFDFSQKDVPPDLGIPYYLQITLFTGSESVEYREDRFANDEFNRANLLASVFAVDTLNSADGRTHMGRITKPDSIDWDHVKSWISFCGGGAHQNSGSNWKTPRQISLLRMLAIDVHTACVSAIPQSAEYVALSYQWGTDQKLKLKIDNKARLETPGFFDTEGCQPSRTIVDAMEVVRRLGHRYLWVDALCIIQDSQEDLDQNVNMMDQIYYNAALTIVAAAGVNAEHGLPGVSVARTEHQIRTVVDGITIANMLEPAAGAITFSRWNTRGWTYQERLLSKKLLTFTDSQVFYHCSHGCNFQEQFHFNRDRYHLAYYDPRAALDLENQNIWEVYALAVAEYTKRSFTDAKDKLRAFSGLANFLSRPLQTHFFFGLPVALFDVALLWVPGRPSDRGPMAFPSWSWAGWNGTVRYAYADSMNNMCECTVSQATITNRPGNFSLCSEISVAEYVPSTYYDRQRWQRDFDTDTLEIIYTCKDQLYKGIRYPRPIASNDNDGRSSFAQESTILEIVGRTAMFRLTDQHSRESNDLSLHKSKCRRGQHELCHLAILDDQGKWAGTIIIDGRLLPKLRNRHHKFVALSRSTRYKIDLDPSWDAKTSTFRHWTAQGNNHRGGEDSDDSSDDEWSNCFFDKEHFDAGVWWPAMNVLLLSEPDQKSVVERMGVGRVHVDAFEAIAKSERILLG